MAAKKLLQRSISFVLMILLASCEVSNTSTDPSEEAGETPRIVSIGGAITETLFALDLGDHLVGIDRTSTFPEATKDIANLGHVSTLNVEAILQLRPTLLIAESSPEAEKLVGQIEKSGVTCLLIPPTFSLDHAHKIAERVNEVIAVPQEKRAALQDLIRADSLALVQTLAAREDRPSVLFLYARGTGRLLVAGQGTSADAVIQMAGGKNAVQSYEGFRALSPEFLLAAQPEVILMFETGLSSLDGQEGLGQIPGMDQTPAYQQGNIITMDGHYLLGFGPRTAEAVGQLASRLTQN